MVYATPAPNGGFSDGAASFNLRDAWRFVPQNATVLAAFEKDNSPAVTRHSVGKGFVDVVWASEIIPTTEGGGYPFFRELAKNAGFTTYCDADVPSLWTNLLENPKNGSYYGTVYHAAWMRTDRPAVTGHTTWKLPQGDYEVTELISGRSLGRKSASELAKTGIETTLDPRAVAVYRFAKPL